MKRQSAVGALLVILLFLLAVGPLDVISGTATERIATGFSRPIFATSPPGDAQRLFVAEQHTGRIEVVDLSSGNNLGAFLDVSGLATGGEEGLLGLAFDPDYANNGYFYVNMTVTGRGTDTVVRRYQVQGDPAASNIADPNSGFDVITYDQPQSNHNGGWIGFGPHDGYLYIASGDGGAGNDSGNGHTAGTGNAQDTTDNLLGKMLRIDPSRDVEPTTPYAVPASNPFVDETGDDEIWAYGLRNPYRASFDRETGDLWIGDVGQGVREEIDFQPADSDGGENYGWRLREGTIATPGGGVGGPRPAGNVDPVYEYTHGGGGFQGFAVIGGYVYHGPVAALQGHYIFADNVVDNIWKLDPDAVDIPASVTRINNILAPDVGSIGSIGSFGEDELGNLYIMEVDSGQGDLFKIVTDSEDIIWNGDDATAGIPGDGTSWASAENWTRGETSDQGFVEDDNVIFAPGSSQTSINLGGDRTVAATTFQASYTLQDDQLRVLSGNVTVEEGVTATIESDLAAETGNQSIRKLGGGTLLVEGNAGQTVVKQGILGGSGTLDHLTVKAGAVAAPGESVGNLSVAESLTLEPGSTLSIEIGGTNSGPENPQYDRLTVGGAAMLGGTLDVMLIDLGEGVFVPGAGDTFNILTASGGFDTFDELNFPDLSPGLTWQLNARSFTLSLSIEIELPGDYNLDGTVNAADYTFWRDTLGDVVVNGSHADGNGDGIVNPEDYDVWQVNFGSSVNTLGSDVVPEPGAAILTVLATLLLLLSRVIVPIGIRAH